MHVPDKPLQLSACSRLSWLSKLNDHFRNEFIHFKPRRVGTSNERCSADHSDNGGNS